MWNEDQKEVLLKVCKNHCYRNAENVIVPEPYWPYVPENWNGILVLAESQSSVCPEYWEWVKKEPTEERMQRLGKNPKEPKEIGIGPWDDRTIKLALQAIFEGANPKLKLEEVAVSNAVPWTRKGTGKNLNPDEQMQAKAAEFWKAIFDVWQPDIKALVILGNIAKRVMASAGVLSDSKYKEKWLKLRLPSPNAINRVSGMFCCDDLEIRFSEVKKARECLGMGQNPRQIFFACHAVSLGVPKFKNCFALHE
jgi:hypothetical protein